MLEISTLKQTVKKEKFSLKITQLHNYSPSTGRDWVMGRREQSRSQGERRRKGRGRMWRGGRGRCRIVTSGCLRGWESIKGVRGRTGADALALNPGLPLLGFLRMGGINS